MCGRYGALRIVESTQQDIPSCSFTTILLQEIVRVTVILDTGVVWPGLAQILGNVGVSAGHPRTSIYSSLPPAICPAPSQAFRYLNTAILLLELDIVFSTSSYTVDSNASWSKAVTSTNTRQETGTTFGLYNVEHLPSKLV
ncbi:hypothetical protein J6590_004213 [Homalodisca vitripennis]|nr:hypothetical protein J6590_004213 [Homalodisca vitripennis]